MHSSFFAPIADEDAPACVSGSVAKWRSFAEDLDYNGPVLWQVKAGFTLWNHAPKAGPCAYDLRGRSHWKLENNKPTTDALVFFIPRIVATGSTAEKAMEVLSWLRKGYDLPEGHCASFGTATLIAGLVLAHLARTGERVPLNDSVARTDTRRKGGSEIHLVFFRKHGLTVFPGYFDDDRADDLGVFPLGIELNR